MIFVAWMDLGSFGIGSASGPWHAHGHAHTHAAFGSFFRAVKVAFSCGGLQQLAHPHGCGWTWIVVGELAVTSGVQGLTISRMNGAFVCKVQAQGCVLCCVFYQLQTSLGLHLQPRRCRVGHRPNATGEHISGTACNGVRGSVVMGDYRGSGPVERGSSSGTVERTA